MDSHAKNQGAPFSGLREKAHLKGLSGSDISLHLLHTYDYSGPIVSKGPPIHLHSGEAKQSSEQERILLELENMKIKALEEHLLKLNIKRKTNNQNL